MAGAPGRPGQLQWTVRGERTSGATHGPGAGLELRSEMKALEGLPLGATRSECVSRRCPWLQVEGGLQGAHGSCWGATTAHSTKAFPSHDLGAPPFQAGIAAPHFAEVETEALGRERPSKGGSSEAVPRPKPVRILLSSLPLPTSFPVPGLCVGVGVCAEDRGPAVLLLPGIRTLEPEGLGLHLVSAT